jgi:hypothetical protein
MQPALFLRDVKELRGLTAVQISGGSTWKRSDEGVDGSPASTYHSQRKAIRSMDSQRLDKVRASYTPKKFRDPPSQPGCDRAELGRRNCLEHPLITPLKPD